MRTKLRRYFRSRAPLLATLVAGAAACRCAAELPAERSVRAVLDAATHASQGPTAPPDATPSAVWEPSRGALTDLLWGRPLLFLRRTAPEAPRDLYRAFVRVTPDGAPLDTQRVVNLTETDVADEQGLIAQGPRAAFATVAYGQVQSVTVLDARGAPVAESSPWSPETWLQRAQWLTTALLESGTLAPPARTDVEFDPPLARVAVELTGAQLRLSAAGVSATFAPTPSTPTLLELEGPAQRGVVVLPRVQQAEPFLHWGADTARALVGNEPVAWLEGRVFGLRDQVRQLNYRMRAPAALEPAPAVRTPREAAPSSEPVWPPPPIAPHTQEPGEGVWVPVRLSYLPRLRGAESAPPYFYRTRLRPDPERPYADVLLVAMDTRRLELGMEAGYEDPRPTAGPPGTGHVPADPERYRRIVATFNGAFKTTHGKYGMVVDRRVLIPPAPGAATVRVDRSGRVGLGTWPAGEPEQELPADLLSLRQNLDPLIEGSVVNPRQRRVWGSQLYGQGVAAERSALCVTRAGHLIYAWAEEASGETLGEALRLAGCTYGLHLDMNPGHCAFMFTDILDFARVDAQAEVLDPRMRVNPKRYVRWSPKDFFYVSLREDAGAVDAANPDSWHLDDQQQPEPTWVPAAFTRTHAVGPLSVELARLTAERFAWSLQPGRDEWHVGVVSEPAPSAEPALAALSLTHATNATRYGLSVAGLAWAPAAAELATLAVTETANLALLAPGEAPPQGTRATVQLPVLARSGQLTARASELGGQRTRGALCLNASGDLLVARLRHDSVAPAVTALLAQGCQLIVELDRGSHEAPALERAPLGESITPQTRGATTLFGAGRPAQPRAYWWRPPPSSAATSP